MTSRERVRAVLAGETPDRVPICDSYWQSTLDRWRGEGMPAGVSPEEHFGLEWFKLGGDYTLQLPGRVLEETERYRVLVDGNGVTQRHLLTPDGWTPHWEGFTLDSPAAFDRLREAFDYRESRLLDDVEARCAYARERELPVFFAAHACFHGTWARTGQENLYGWMVEQPDFVHRLFEAHTELIIGLYEGLKRRGAAFDAAFLADDLGSTRSPLISPRMYRELVKPHHRRLFQHFRDDGVPPILHSDGNVAPLIPDFLDAGVRGLHPLEAKAGLHVADLRREYGDRLVLFGNIDVRALAGSPEDVVREVTTKLAAARGGGYLYHSDHSVPADVPLRNYELALATAREQGVELRP
ncbi:MAG: hypothetical protein HYU66_28230 [Armatimonadetes bacterium]|nr:hypothetical protein [Armatimonadota bacterium]